MRGDLNRRARQHELLADSSPLALSARAKADQKQIVFLLGPSLGLRFGFSVVPDATRHLKKISARVKMRHLVTGVPQFMSFFFYRKFTFSPGTLRWTYTGQSIARSILPSLDVVRGERVFFDSGGFPDRRGETGGRGASEGGA